MSRDLLEIQPILHWIGEFSVTEMGKTRLHSLQLGNREEAEERRLIGIEVLEAHVHGHPPALVRCANLDFLIKASEQRSLSGLELMDIKDAVECSLSLKSWGQKYRNYQFLSKMLRSIPDLSDLALYIDSKINSRGEIREDADSRLPKLKLKVKECEKGRKLKFDMIAESLSNQGALQQRQPVQRHGKLLLAVKSGHARKISGAIVERSQSGDTFYVEPSSVMELHNQITELIFKIERIEQEILRELSLKVLRYAEKIKIFSNIVVNLDVAISCCEWSSLVGASYPFLAERESGINLHQARHPELIKKIGLEQVEPLSLRLGDAYDLLVVTGPNTGGKTLVLKTLGVATWMANCGLPICANSGSQLVWVDKIFADLGDAQSIEQSLSTFSGHLVRIQNVLAEASSSSLILLDELGTGTDPEEGTAIGQAVLENLLERKSLCVANTHLGRLKLFSINVERAENASMEFDPVDLLPKFRLLVGVPGASHAVEVAEGIGLDSAVLARARELASRESNSERFLSDIAQVRRQAEIIRQEASVEELRVLEASRKLVLREEELTRQQNLRMREYEQLFVEHQAKVAKILEVNGDNQLANRIMTLFYDHSLASRWSEFTQQLVKGMKIYVPKLREKVQITKIDKKRKRVRVAQGSLTHDIPFSELTWVEESP